MSDIAMLWAWKQKIPAFKKIVLLCYVKHSGFSNCACVNKKIIAEECGMSEKEIEIYTEWLVHNHYLIDCDSRKFRRYDNCPKTYRLNFSVEEEEQNADLANAKKWSEYRERKKENLNKILGRI